MQASFYLFCIVAVMACTPTFSRRSLLSLASDWLSASTAAPGTEQSHETVTIEQNVRMENNEGEVRNLDRPAPVIMLSQGQQYSVEIKFSEGGTRRSAVFGRWSPPHDHLKGFWPRQLELRWEEGPRRGELSASDYGPSGKCLITFWVFDQARVLQGSSKEVY